MLIASDQACASPRKTIQKRVLLPAPDVVPHPAILSWTDQAFDQAMVGSHPPVAKAPLTVLSFHASRYGSSKRTARNPA